MKQNQHNREQNENENFYPEGILFLLIKKKKNLE
jgi:hypothetical protein